jgi:hypothetical protein
MYAKWVHSVHTMSQFIHGQILTGFLGFVNEKERKLEHYPTVSPLDFSGSIL